MRSQLIISLTFLAWGSLSLHAATVEPHLREEFWVIDGNATAFAERQGILYVGGTFTAVGPSTGSGVPLSGDSGQPVPGFASFAGSVRTVIADPAGGWFVGGNFLRVGGELHQRLVHLRADCSVDSSWRVDCDAAVSSLTLNSGVLYLGGEFTTVNGGPRRSLAAVNAATGALTPWSVTPNGAVGLWRRWPWTPERCSRGRPVSGAKSSPWPRVTGACLSGGVPPLT